MAKHNRSHQLDQVVRDIRSVGKVVLSIVILLQDVAQVSLGRIPAVF